MNLGITENRALLVSDIIDAMERIAPPQLAEEWDNCGLQAGSGHWSVDKVWVSLDPHPAVIRAAADENVDMLVTHHPLIFHPLQRIDVQSPVGSILQTVLTAQIAIYAAHTNLDCAPEGVNAILAQRIGLTDLVPLVATRCDQMKPNAGLGRVGRLSVPLTLRQFAREIKNEFNLNTLKICGDPQLEIRQVALCSGGGSSVLNEFLASNAQVFVSGDLRYHDARTVADHRRGLIDLGHFASEQIMIDAVARQLQNQARSSGWTLTIEPCHIERDPFQYI
jgi:dinuclear metal center YbgI/SA1388 family protein